MVGTASPEPLPTGTGSSLLVAPADALRGGVPSGLHCRCGPVFHSARGSPTFFMRTLKCSCCHGSEGVGVTMADVVSLRTWYEIWCHHIPSMHFHASLCEGHICPCLVLGGLAGARTVPWTEEPGPLQPPETCGSQTPLAQGVMSLLHPLLPPVLHSSHQHTVNSPQK